MYFRQHIRTQRRKELTRQPKKRHEVPERLQYVRREQEHERRLLPPFPPMPWRRPANRRVRLRKSAPDEGKEGREEQEGDAGEDAERVGDAEACKKRRERERDGNATDGGS